MKLVLAEHDNHDLRPATLNTVTAAARLPGETVVLVTGYKCQPVVQQAAMLAGVDRVLHADAEHFEHQLAEELGTLVASIAGPVKYILAPATTFGKNVLPRIAALLDVDPVSDIVDIVSEDTFVRPIYAGNALATVQSTDQVRVITVRATAFDPCPCNADPAPVESVEPTPESGLSALVGQQLSGNERPELTTAKIVVSGGRGFGNAENFRLLEQLADRLNAAIGASRAAVDSGFISNDFQVGQTGKVVAPQLYMALGVSGAIQHIAGMKDSKVIVAVNKDADAPIFDIADYGLVMDLFEFIPQFLAGLEESS